MSDLRTAILLAGLTALFMAVGYLLGGSSGAVVAFFVAAAMNFVTYWNADRLVLSMHGAREVDERTAPEFVFWRSLDSKCGQLRATMPRISSSTAPMSSKAS